MISRARRPGVFARANYMRTILLRLPSSSEFPRFLRVPMSSPILISGLVNIETTVRVDGFPIPYFPVRYPFFGVRSTVSGVGVNISTALSTLGNPVRLLSLVGDDAPGRLAREALRGRGLDDRYVLAQAAETAQSAILYDGDGRRQIHVDLKDIQEQVYPTALFDEAAEGCRLAVLCNINFSRPLLALARGRGMVIASDVHAIAELDDPYNADFMRAADAGGMGWRRVSALRQPNCGHRPGSGRRAAGGQGRCAAAHASRGHPPRGQHHRRGRCAVLGLSARLHADQRPLSGYPKSRGLRVLQDRRSRRGGGIFRCGGSRKLGNERKMRTKV